MLQRAAPLKYTLRIHVGSPLGGASREQCSVLPWVLPSALSSSLAFLFTRQAFLSAIFLLLRPALKCKPASTRKENRKSRKGFPPAVAAACPHISVNREPRNRIARIFNFVSVSGFTQPTARCQLIILIESLKDDSIYQYISRLILI